MIIGYTVTTDHGSIDFTSDPDDLCRLAALQTTLTERGDGYGLVAHSDAEPVPYLPVELMTDIETIVAISARIDAAFAEDADKWAADKQLALEEIQQMIETRKKA